MGFRLATLAAVALLAGGGNSAYAAATCAAPPVVTFVEFARGSAQLPYRIASNHVARVVPMISTYSRIVSHSAVAMGDLAEGEEWERASPEARKADQALASARAKALERMFRRLPARYRAANVGARVGVRRQTATDEQRANKPAVASRPRSFVQTWFRLTLEGGVIPAC